MPPVRQTIMITTMAPYAMEERPTIMGSLTLPICGPSPSQRRTSERTVMMTVPSRAPVTLNMPPSTSMATCRNMRIS